MKKFFILAAMVGAAFTGCVNDEEVVLKQKEDSPKPITFEVAKYKPASRAEGDGTSTTSTDDGTVAFETTKTFGAFAYKKEPGSQVHESFMNNVQILYYQNGNYWAPERVTEVKKNENGEVVNDDNGNPVLIEKFYVWPTDGHLDFICYAPYQKDLNSPKIPKISDNDAQNTLMYENYDIEVDGVDDLMYSDKAVWQTANSSYYGFVGVPTLFRHALAKLSFAVKAVKLDNHLTALGDAYKHSWEITVNSITLNKIYKEGSVTMTTNSSNVTSATTTQWTNSLLENNVTTNYNVWNVNTAAETVNTVAEGEGTTTSTTPYMQPKEWVHAQALTTDARIYNSNSTTDAAENYFVIPQTLSGQTITITYTVVTKDKDGNVTNTVTHTPEPITFKSITDIPAWEMGKSITYIIEIDPEGDVIHFAPRVVDWEAQNGVISI